jgi:hypothetical protein
MTARGNDMANVIKRDGEVVASGLNGEIDILDWFHKHTSQSMDWMCKHEGYSVHEVEHANLIKAREELNAKGIQYTRKDYISGTVDHQTYYAQFVSDSVINLIGSRIGKECILASTNEHFNDIPLSKWDGLALLVPARLVSLSNMFTQAESTAVPSVSLSDKVCILKAAAQTIRNSK